ncbi:MAG: 30S ribosomal protein S8 [Candidatus Spechtbacteria bacterium]|nr:30S ribosomal protein S8 [Candidatus Spechtbacteria bacterium]
MHSDPIADMLNRIKNASILHHEVVKIPYSKVKGQLADLLLEEGFLAGVDRKKDGVRKYLVINLRYEGGASAVNGVARISKPGRRMYVKAAEVKPVKHGYGCAVISTSKGLMTDKRAREKGLGGEFFCKVW